MTAFKDYYKILSIDPGASGAVVRVAYRALSSQHHPDKEGGDESFMKDVNEAYSCLIEDKTRREYDGVYFLRKNTHSNPTRIDSSEKWIRAVKLYPDLQRRFDSLTFYSENLAFDYRNHMLKSRLFEFGWREFDSFQKNFLVDKFGKQNSIFIQFAKFLYSNHQAESVKTLSEYAEMLGSDIPEKKVKEIIGLICPTYFRPVMSEKRKKENSIKNWISFTLWLGAFLVATWVFVWKKWDGDPVVLPSPVTQKIDAPPKEASSVGVSDKASVIVAVDDGVVKPNYPELPLFDLSKFSDCRSASALAGVRACESDVIKNYEVVLNEAVEFHQIRSTGNFDLKKIVNSFNYLRKNWCKDFEAMAWGPGNGVTFAVTLCEARAYSWFGSLVNGAILSKLNNRAISCEALGLSCSSSDIRNGEYLQRAKKIEAWISRNAEKIYAILFDQQEYMIGSQEYSAELLFGFSRSADILLDLDNKICGGRFFSISNDEKAICQLGVWSYFLESMGESQSNFQKLIDENLRKS